VRLEVGARNEFADSEHLGQRPARPAAQLGDESYERACTQRIPQGQRRWSLTSLAGLEADATGVPAASDGERVALDGVGHNPSGSVGLEPAENIERRQRLQGVALPALLPATGRSRLPAHLEDTEWSRLALGVAAEVLASLGIPVSADVLQLDPDSVTVHLPTSESPQWPFSLGRAANSWTLPRDSRIIASLPVTPAITSAARKAALVTLSEIHGRRSLVDLVAVGSTILKDLCLRSV